MMQNIIAFFTDFPSLWFFAAFNIYPWMKLKEFGIWNNVDVAYQPNPLLSRQESIHKAMNSVYQYGMTSVRGYYGVLAMLIGFVGAMFSTGHIGVARWAMSVYLNHIDTATLLYSDMRWFGELKLGLIYNSVIYLTLLAYINMSRSIHKYDIFFGLIVIKTFSEAYIAFSSTVPSGITTLFPL